MPDLQRTLVAQLSDGGRPEIGPFVVRFDATSDSPYRNYAAPARADLVSPDQVADLVRLFHARGLAPRVEYVENAALTAALLAAGFSIARELPLLVLDADGVVTPDPPPGISVRAALDRADLIGAAAVQVMAYGDTEPVPVSADRLAATIERGGSVAVAHDPSGRVVGAGLHTAPRLGFAEIAAVAVDEAYRWRGIGAAVSAEACRLAVALGARPYLQAEGETEARMYRRIGFARVGSFVLADGPPAPSRDAQPARGPGG